MKKIALFSLLAAAVLMVAPKPAAASDKGLAILGGVIGGLIIANTLDHDSHHTTVVHVDHRSGYWDERPVDVWVEGRWVVSYDRDNCRVRRYIAGHYETEIRRIWVSTSYRRPSYSHNHRKYDRHHRSSRYDRHHRREHRRNRHW